MQTWLERLFHVPVAEQGKTAMVLVYIFFAASACVVGRTAADTLFLARIGADQLAWMYVVSAIVVAVAALLYARLARRMTLRALLVATHVLLAVAAVALRWVLTEYHHHTYVIAPIYLLSEIQGAMAGILFATVLNELFRGDDARGVFGIAGVGSTVSGIVFGGLMAFEAYNLHAANLLYVMAGLHLLTLASVVSFRSARTGRAAVETAARADLAEGLLDIGVGCVNASAASPRAASPRDASPRDVPAIESAEFSPPEGYSRWLVALAVVQFPTIMLIGFQWKIAVNDAYHDSEDAMAAYFGGYYAIVNIVTFVLQTAFAGRLLKHFGLLPALLSFPIALGLAATTIAAASSERVLLWAATMSKGAESLRRSFSDPAFQLLYFPLPQAQRRQLIAAIGGGVKPLVEAVAALAILEVTFLTGAHDISYVVAALVFMWIVLAVGCRRRYREAIDAEESGKAASPAAPETV
ncbi:MAG: MFS transporter [Pirellulaceae bacterium]